MKVFCIKFLLAALMTCFLSNISKASIKQLNPDFNANTFAISDTTKDKQQIQTLIRKLLVWTENDKVVPDLLPIVVNRRDSMVTGFDVTKLKGISDSLRITGFFSEKFISNYNQIIRVLDRRMKAKEIEPFSTGDMPPFSFDTDANPWCNCQELPYDKPDPFSLVEVHIIELNAKIGKMYWAWGSLPKNESSGWERIRHNFEVINEGGKWKISYLQGFDIKTAE